MTGKRISDFFLTASIIAVTVILAMCFACTPSRKATLTISKTALNPLASLPTYDPLFDLPPVYEIDGIASRGSIEFVRTDDPAQFSHLVILSCFEQVLPPPHWTLTETLCNDINEYSPIEIWIEYPNLLESPIRDSHCGYSRVQVRCCEEWVSTLSYETGIVYPEPTWSVAAICHDYDTDRDGDIDLYDYARSIP